MSSDPASSSAPASDPVDRDHAPGPLPPASMVAAGILLLIPLVALALVPVYASDGPRLWGFPFFYWYQLLWVFIAAGCTYSAYLVVAHARGRR